MKQLTTPGANDLTEHARPNKPQRSRFDLSKITNLTLEPGMIVPVDLFEVLPGDEIDISNEMVLDTLPMIAPSLTKYKILVHWYFMKARDCWKGFKTFWTRGRSGNVNLTVPTLNPELKLANGTLTLDGQEISGYYKEKGYHSLTSYLTGIPSDINGTPKEMDISEETAIYDNTTPYCFWSNENGFVGNFTGHKKLSSKINALPFVMYQSIVKNNYVNENLLQNNAALFPEEGDDDWILPYNATEVNFIGRGETDNTGWNDASPADADDWKFDYTGVFHNDDTRVRLDCLRYAMFDNDYFTNGLPWLQRGELTTGKGLMEFELEDIQGEITANETAISQAVRGNSTQGYPELDSAGGYVGVVNAESHNYTGKINLMTAPIAAALGVSLTGTATSTLTTNQLREMIAMQVWMERNARVDGSYNKMIFQHWMENPNSEEHKPIYIGGTADYMTFATVVQNSESTDTSPLGSTAGFGNARGGNKAGSFRASDFGYCMAIMIIKPDTTYEQGLEHFWKHEKVFDKMVQPEFQGLSPEPIYNDEIYVQGNEDTNNGLLCYQERYQYLKQRLNQNKGMFTAAPEKDRLFSAYTQARWLKSLPTFNYEFLCMYPGNMRRDMLAYPNYPMFRCQFASKVFVTRKLAYTSEPETFGF